MLITDTDEKIFGIVMDTLKDNNFRLNECLVAIGSIFSICLANVAHNNSKNLTPDEVIETAIDIIKRGTWEQYNDIIKICCVENVQ